MNTAETYEQKANIGEWSEIYTLFKILDERSILAADKNLDPIPNNSYTFLKIFREDEAGSLYEYNLERDGIVIIKDAHGTLIKTLDTSTLKDKTIKIFDTLIGDHSGTFTISEATNLMDEYLIKKVKAKSGEKVDLLAEVADAVGRSSSKLGFSIKSRAGSSSTLVNSSKHTMLQYEISGLNESIEKVNQEILQLGNKKRIARLKEMGVDITFSKLISPVYESNLKYIDSRFEEILAEMVLTYYSSSPLKMTSDLVRIVSGNAKIGMNQEMLEYKVKSYYKASALGMVPAKAWGGLLDAYGGYIVVMKNGRLLCYHLNTEDAFMDYLYGYTYFDTAATKNGGEFAYLYEEDGKIYFDLNYIIRFSK